ncbi:hypothetical protein TcasGA2_TC009829 [Tribolium castaneum]|uniref:Uncharacterized protein n=1 Tax=Tribolium castaneum TaxID=7070 RepID=D6WPW3_TRICA|nr:hypothetical protein TcasGA2_TC009829 [Tribolium castaneum]
MESPSSSCISLISTDSSRLDYLNTFRDASEQESETIEALKLKQLQLKRNITDLAYENEQYRARYEDLRHKLGDLTDLLEKGAHILANLYDNSKNALQNTPILDSVNKPNIRNQDTASKIKKITRPIMHIEPLNMQEVRQEADLEEERTHDCLPIIFEDSVEWVDTVVDPHVHLDRLPDNVVENYLNEQNLANSHLSKSAVSTSLKLETMENERPKANAKKVKVSPKKARVAPKVERKSKKRGNDSATKKSKLSSQESGDFRSQRSTRRKRLCTEGREFENEEKP